MDSSILGSLLGQSRSRRSSEVQPALCGRNNCKRCHSWFHLGTKTLAQRTEQMDNIQAATESVLAAPAAPWGEFIPKNMVNDGGIQRSLQAGSAGWTLPSGSCGQPMLLRPRVSGHLGWSTWHRNGDRSELGVREARGRLGGRVFRGQVGGVRAVWHFPEAGTHVTSLTHSQSQPAFPSLPASPFLGSASLNVSMCPDRGTSRSQWQHGLQG